MNGEKSGLEIQQPSGVDCTSTRGEVCLGLRFEQPVGQTFDLANPCHAFGFVMTPDEARDLAEQLLHAADDADAPDTLYIAADPD